MRLTWWTTLGLIVLAIVLFGAALLSATAPASCGKADDSRKVGLLRQASKAYADARADEPGSDCARKGLAKLAVKICERGQVLDRGGDPAGAEKMYVFVREQEPLPTLCEAERSCEHAVSSQEAGLYAQADKAYASLRDNEPGSACAAAGAAKLAIALCRRADRLRWAGQMDAARAAYVALFRREPVGALSCVRKGLKKLGGTPPPRTSRSDDDRGGADQDRRVHRGKDGAAGGDGAPGRISKITIICESQKRCRVTR